jgi:DNA-binding MarR family transcriptional regulator
MATPKKPRAAKQLEEGVLELTSLLGRVFRNLKQRGDPPPQAFRAAFEKNGLGPRHMPVMIAVTLQGGMSVSAVAERIGLSVATTSLLVGELSRAGLLKRTEDASDRRRTLVTLHDDQREVMQEFVHQIVQPLRRTLERLPPKARVDFLEGWRLLDEESAGQPSADGCAGTSQMRST